MSEDIKEKLDLFPDNMNEIAKEAYYQLESYINNLQHENQQLKKQLDYIRSGEYFNQLRFERDMLQNIVDNGEVSKEDKEFIDMTHRNTELLEQLKQRDEIIDKVSKLLEYYYIGNLKYDKESQRAFERIFDLLNRYKRDNND